MRFQRPATESKKVGRFKGNLHRLILCRIVSPRRPCASGRLPRQSVGRLSVRLADVDVDELVKALHMERSTWIKAPKEQGRRETDAEKVTICVLAALEHVFANAGASSDPHLKPPSG